MKIDLSEQMAVASDEAKDLRISDLATQDLSNQAIRSEIMIDLISFKGPSRYPNSKSHAQVTPIKESDDRRYEISTVKKLSATHKQIIARKAQSSMINTPVHLNSDNMNPTSITSSLEKLMNGQSSKLQPRGIRFQNSISPTVKDCDTHKLNKDLQITNSIGNATFSF